MMIVATQCSTPLRLNKDKTDFINPSELERGKEGTDTSYDAYYMYKWAKKYNITIN